jgi:hypothetical protein
LLVACRTLSQATLSYSIKLDQMVLLNLCWAQASW